MTDEQLVDGAVGLAAAANEPEGVLPLSQVHLLRAIALTREEVHRKQLHEQAVARAQQQVANVGTIALAVLRVIFLGV